MKAAVIGAFATVIASAVFGGLQLNWFGGGPGQGGTTTTSTTTTATEVSPVSSRDGAVTAVLPRDWGHGESRWNVGIAGKVDPGDGVRGGVGTGLVDNTSYDTSSAWLGASSVAARRLGLKGRSPDELSGFLTEMARTLDWTQDSCTFVRENTVTKQGYLGTYRLWSGCRGFRGTRYWDLYAASTSGDVLVQMQLVGTPSTTESEEEGWLSAWSVRPELLPSGLSQPVTKSLFGPSPWTTAGHVSFGDQVIP